MLLFLVVAAYTAPVAAQTTTAGIDGFVTDESGARLPGVTLTATSAGTGMSRATVSDAEGRYGMSNLPPGSYDVTAELAGFGTAVRSQVVLQVGDALRISFTLAVGGIEQVVTVVGEVPLVQTTKSDLGSVISGGDLAEMPLNGRSLHQLVGLQVGVSNLSQVRGATSFSIGGSWDSQNSYMMDGARVQSDSAGVPTGASGSMMGMESLQEFRVLTHNFAAEFGLVSGGIVNAVTKSGGNSLHGSAFEYFRNSKLDAKNYFDRNPEPPPFSRHQFGGSLGGPIIRNKTFFYGNYEGYRDKLGQTLIAFVPDDDAHRGIIAGQNIGVAPEIAPFLELYPRANGAAIGGGIAEYAHEYQRPTTENYVMGKVSHNFSNNLSIFGRYFLTDGSRDSLLDIPTGFVYDVTRNQSVVGESTWVLGPHLVNVTRFGFGRNFNDTLTEDTVTAPYIFHAASGRLGNIQVNGLTDIAPTQMSPRTFIINTYDLATSFAYSQGAHSWKVGAGFQYVQNDTLLTTNGNGTYIFTSLQGFLTGRASSFESEQPSQGETMLHFRQWIPHVYAQDDWKATDRLTLNLGLRYEMFTLDETEGRYANLQRVTDPEPTVGVLFPNNPSTKNIQPRFGFAWDVLGDAKLSLHGGAGVYFQVWPPRDYNRQNGPPFQPSVVTLANPPFPNAEAVIANLSEDSILRYDAYAQNLKGPGAYHMSLGVDRQIARDMSVSVNYVRKLGRWLIRRSNDNTRIPTFLEDGRVFYAANAPLINPGLSNIVYRHTDGQGEYNALQVQFQKRPGALWGMTVNYTFAKAMDNTSSNLNITSTGPSRGADVANPYDPMSDYGLSSFDVRHQFNARMIFNLPSGESVGSLRHLVGGWQLTGILTAQTGVPFTAILGVNRSRDGNTRRPERPNLAAGASNNPILGDPNRWFDVTAFVFPEAGFYGNLGRNTLSAPNLMTVDMSLVKNFNAGANSSRKIQVRIDVFNLLNRANFAAPEHTIFDSRGNYVATAGRITNTTTPARQIQLVGRFDF